MDASVVRIFEQVLDVTDLVEDDTVFTLGGDSLQVVVIASEMEACFGIPVRPEDVGDKTITEIGDWLYDALKSVV